MEQRIADYLIKFLSDNAKNGFIFDERPTTNLPKINEKFVSTFPVAFMGEFLLTLVKEGTIVYAAYEEWAKKMVLASEKRVKYCQALNILARSLGYKDHKAVRDKLIERGDCDKNGAVKSNALINNYRSLTTINLRALQG